MKQLLTFAILFVFSWCSWAQISINVSGHVENTDGTPAENVTIYIATDSSFVWPGYYNSLQTDASGNYSDTFDVPDNATQGAVFVTMLDCSNDYQFETLYWNPGSLSLTADFIYCDLSDDCSVFVVLDSLPVSGGQGLYAAVSYNGSISYNWSTGETTQSIEVFESGTYCVTISDSEGCTASDCIVVDLSASNCSVDIGLNPSGAISASALGTAPFAYAWSTGELTASIFPTTAGNYCVTVTDADGCEASDCYYYYTQQDTFCYVTIYPIQGGTLLQADAGGTPPFTYAWNTQETTSTIALNGPGTYCVTITDATGCTASDCYTLASPNNFAIEGFLYLQDSSLFQQIFGTVYLYEYVNGDLALVDSTDYDASTPSGVAWYSFGDVPEGQYIVLGTLDPASPGYADNLPTYHINSIFWNEAMIIDVPYAGNAYFNIVFVEGNPPEGPGLIGGTVEDMGFTSGDERDDPLLHAVILLLDENDQPLSHTKMDENGEFRFENLAWGTYKVYLEIPGHEQQYVVVTIGPDNPEVRDIEFEVEGGTVTSTIDVAKQNQLTVFPNPAQDVLNIQIENATSGKAWITVASTSGNRLVNDVLNISAKSQTVQVNISQLVPGIYFLSLNQGSELQTLRFVKK